MGQFYAYMWLREDGTPYYVGKGVYKRAFVMHQKNGGRRLYPPKDRSRILIFNRGSEQEAIETEKELIRNWGRKDLGTGCLRNFTDGGDGSSGYKHTEEELRKMSINNKGRHHSPMTEFTSESWKGKKRPPFSKEHRQHISESHKGLNVGHPNYTTLEGIEKMRLVKKGKKASVETRQRMSASQKLAWLKRKAQGGSQLSS